LNQAHAILVFRNVRLEVFGTSAKTGNDAGDVSSGALAA
jgi:hypothetical protein